MSNIIVPTFNEKRMTESLEYLVSRGHNPIKYSNAAYKETAITIPHIVTNTIQSFRTDHVISVQVLHQLEYLLEKDKENPGKLALITDGSYCNFRLLVRPRYIWFTSDDRLADYPDIHSIVSPVIRDIIKVIDLSYQYAERIMITLDKDEPTSFGY